MYVSFLCVLIRVLLCFSDTMLELQSSQHLRDLSCVSSIVPSGSATKSRSRPASDAMAAAPGDWCTCGPVLPRSQAVSAPAISRRPVCLRGTASIAAMLDLQDVSLCGGPCAAVAGVCLWVAVASPIWQAVSRDQAVTQLLHGTRDPLSAAPCAEACHDAHDHAGADGRDPCSRNSVFHAATSVLMTLRNDKMSCIGLCRMIQLGWVQSCAVSDPRSSENAVMVSMLTSCKC